jgi:hypothetical protein
MKSYKWTLLLALLSTNAFILNEGHSKEADSLDVKITIQPKESNGQPVIIRFQAENPSLPSSNFSIQYNKKNDNKNWEILGPSQSQSSQITFANGKMIRKSSLSLTFQLYPLKTGQLKTPIIEVKINDKVYITKEENINVKSLSSNRGTPYVQTPQSPSFPFFKMFNLDEEESPQDFSSENKSRRLEVFVVGDPSKTQVYEGELITLPFYIYTNENIFRNLEFGSFPTFKDFLKEQLFIPKNWKPERTQYRNNYYFKTEIIRFALFPVKTGELLIDPLKMRFEVDNDIFQLLEQMQNPKHHLGQNQTFMRSSGSIPIEVKPLPIKPPSITQVSVPVGHYKLSVLPPEQNLTQNQAFSLKIRIEGKGNIKGIEEPEIKFPESLKKSRTATSYQINDQSEGFKDFEMLIVPQEAGNIKISENNWSYFDPEKKSYETLAIPSLELRIDPSSKTEAPTKNKEKKIVYSGTQDFVGVEYSNISLFLWCFPLSLYALAFFLFVQRKKREEEDLLREDYPWLFIEKKIHNQNQNLPKKLEHMEQWILSRFSRISKEEASFDDLMMSLINKCPGSTHSKILKLRDLFNKLEATRFGKNKLSSNFSTSFEEIKRLSEEIIHSFELSSSLQPPSESSDDE